MWPASRETILLPVTIGQRLVAAGSGEGAEPRALESGAAPTAATTVGSVGTVTSGGRAVGTTGVRRVPDGGVAAWLDRRAPRRRRCRDAATRHRSPGSRAWSTMTTAPTETGQRKGAHRAANRVLDAAVADDRQQEGGSEQRHPSVERERAAF